MEYSAKIDRMIAIVRDTIGDVENRSPVLTIRCVNADITSAMLTIIGGKFLVTTNDEASNLSLVLDDYRSIYDLRTEIETNGSFVISLPGEDESYSFGGVDPSDLETINVAKNILTEAYTVRALHWFSDRKIYQWLVDTCLRKLPDYDVDNVLDDDELYLSLCTALHGITLLMANAAKYYPFSIDGFSGNKGSAIVSYQALYRTVEDQIANIGVPMLEGNILTPSRITGTFVPSSYVDRAVPVRLVSAVLDGSNVALTWTQSLLRDFYCYEIWRNSGSSYELLYTENNQTVTSYVDTLTDDGTYTYKVRVVIKVSVPAGNEYPSTIPSAYRKYADSRELSIVFGDD